MTLVDLFPDALRRCLRPPPPPCDTGGTRVTDARRLEDMELQALTTLAGKTLTLALNGVRHPRRFVL